MGDLYPSANILGVDLRYANFTMIRTAGSLTATQSHSTGMGTAECQIYGRRRREYLAEAFKLFRLCSLEAYCHGHQRLAEIDAERSRVSYINPWIEFC